MSFIPFLRYLTYFNFIDMKQFIEVTDVDQKKHLLNISHISRITADAQWVGNAQIYFSVSMNDIDFGRIETVETYDDLRNLISSALE